MKDRIITMLIMAGLACGVIAICTMWFIVPCHFTARVMELDYRWSITTGCLIKVNERWVPLRSYRVIE